MVKHEEMPVLSSIEKSFSIDKPLAGWGILVHMHLTNELLRLGNCLRVGCGQVYYWPSNRNPTETWIAEQAVTTGGHIVTSFEDLPVNLEQPFLIIEGNGKFFSLIHDTPDATAFLKTVKGISEHTSGGGNIIDRYNHDKIKIPVVAVYRDPLKYQLETGLGTSQSTVASLFKGLNEPVAGRKVHIIGYGKVGSGCARSLAALGAHMLVSDISSEKCLMAKYSGFQVVTIEQGIRKADICITTTGTASILNEENLEKCRDGLLVANVSNVPKEIDTDGCINCGELDKERVLWKTKKGKRFEVLAGGIQVNHVLGNGNPSSLMDLSLSLHAMVIKWLAVNKPTIGLTPVPDNIRNEVTSCAMNASTKENSIMELFDD